MNIAVHLHYVLSDAPPVAFKDLDVVRLTREVQDECGRLLPIGSMGTVVMTYAEGSAFEVEFVKPFETLATIGVEGLELVQAV